jgi:hypothetical protein
MNKILQLNYLYLLGDIKKLTYNKCFELICNFGNIEDASKFYNYLKRISNGSKS